ncbi:MAG: transcriptional regulator [Pirellulaceae bacterium]|nr:MAG: transcriptional regulator [Pirellulaceae bacterium]
MSTTTDNRCWVGFDLGGTKMQCSLFDDALRPLGHRRRRTKSELGVDGCTERIVQTIRQTLEQHQPAGTTLGGIGIGCPGPVDWQRGRVHVAVNLGWNDVPIAKILEDAFDCPVTVLNDVDAGVYGEYVGGAGKGARTILGIFPGTGIGGGCVYDGQILRGKSLTCMEIGHVKICDSPRPGATGMTGTLENEASRLAIAGELVKLAYRGEAPHLRELVGTELGAIRSKTIAEAIAHGDQQVEAAVTRACTIIGYAVANMVLLMCPDRVILGGGLVEAMPERFVKQVSKIARQHVFECYRDEFKVVAASLGDDAAVVGAAAWARQQLGSAVDQR